MKIVFINSVKGFGSTGRICISLQENFRNFNVDSTICYGRKKKNDESNDKNFYFGSTLDNLNHGIFSLLFDSHGLKSKSKTIKLIKFIESYEPDIIHLHNVHGYYLNYPILFKYLIEKQIPTVMTLHDMWWITGHSAYMDDNTVLMNEDYYRFDDKRKYPRALKKNFYRNFTKKKYLLEQMDNLTIVTPSKWLKTIIDNTYLQKFDTRVIYNGINLDKFNRTVDDEKYKNFTILGVANIWEERKGLNVFIELSKIIDDNSQIILVGKLPKGTTLPKNCINFNHISDITELATIYKKSHVFLNPTLSDNFPTTNIEALASGIPVVTFNTGGSGEIITSEKIGDCVEDYDVNNLKNILDKYKKYDYNLANECRKSADLYASERMSEEYYKLFERILNK